MLYNFTMPSTHMLSTQVVPGRMEDTPAGGLIIRDVRLLACGTWTDSNIGTPLYYSADHLRASVDKWLDRSLWNRHGGGAPRSITDRVGMVVNPRYEDDAVVGDLHLHGLTTQSRDAIAMIKAASRGELPPYYVSVEHYSDDVPGADGRLMATNIQYVGAAIVNMGACAKCRINAANSNSGPRELGYVPDNPKGYGKAPVDTPWEAPNLSDFTSKRWDELTMDEKRRIASCYAYVTTLDTFGGLKLPHHKPNGDVVWRGVVAALQRLDQTDDVDKAAARKHLEAHYTDFDKELPKEPREDSMSEQAILEQKLEAVRKELETVKQAVIELEAVRKELETLRLDVKKLSMEPARPTTSVVIGEPELIVLE